MSQKITLLEYAELKNSTINDIVKNAEAKGVCISSDPSYILDDSTLKQIDPIFFHNRKYPQLKNTETPHEPMVLGNIDLSSLNLTTRPTRKSKEKKNSSISDALVAQLKDYAVKHQNERVVGKVDRVMPHGAYISLGDISGFLYAKDVAWGFIDDIQDYLLEGEKIEVIVIGFDEEKKKLLLGKKQLMEDPLFNIVDKLEVGSEIEGVLKGVSKKNRAYLEIENNAIAEAEFPTGYTYPIGQSISGIIKSNQ